MPKPVIQLCAAFLIYIVPVSSTAQEDDDGVTLQCLFHGINPTVCECATDALSQKLAVDVFAFYNDIGRLAIPLMENGADMGDAYDTALAETATRRRMANLVALQTNNAAGRAHRDAITHCGG